MQTTTLTMRAAVPQRLRHVRSTPDNLSAQIMMHADKVTQKGEGKVVAIIDTGVDMYHSAFRGNLSGTPRHR